MTEYNFINEATDNNTGEVVKYVMLGNVNDWFVEDSGVIYVCPSDQMFEQYEMVDL